MLEVVKHFGAQLYFYSFYYSLYFHISLISATSFSQKAKMKQHSCLLSSFLKCTYTGIVFLGKDKIIFATEEYLSEPSTAILLPDDPDVIDTSNAGIG